jgi:hypothetical protein
LDHPLLELAVAADELRLGKPLLQIAHEFVGIVAERNRADALVGCGDEDRAQRTFADREPDRCAAAAGAKARRRHP